MQILPIGRDGRKGRKVTLGAGASLQGAISLTETCHVDENGDQNTIFTNDQRYRQT